MEQAFQTVLSMSLRGTAAALIIWIITAALRRTRCARTPLLLLWAVVAFRLVCPWSPTSPLSVFSLTTEVRTEQITTEQTYTPSAPNDSAPAELPNEDVVLDQIGGTTTQNHNPETPSDIVTAETTSPYPVIWLAGAGLLLVYTAVASIRLKRRIRFAVKDGDEPSVWLCDKLDSPCVIGIFRPRIYLVPGMTEEEQRCVLTHEGEHLRVGDNLWMAISWLILCVHWFNPLLWLARGAFVGAVEDACDQRVLRKFGAEYRTDYSRALLSLSTHRPLCPGPGPVAFGDGNTKKRIRSILNYRKPILGITAAALLVGCIVGIAVLTDPKESPTLPTGEYELGEVLSLSLFSSSTPDFYYEKSRGTRFEITDSSFTVKGKGFISDAHIPDPIYEELKLGDTLSTWEFSDKNGETDDSPFYISIPEGTVGWEVLTGDGEHTGWKILMCADEMCIGRWYTEGSSGTITHCDFFARILPASGEDEPEDTAPLDPDPSAVTPPDADAEELIQWEDLELHWTFPTNMTEPADDGFSFYLSFPFDYYNITCSGGTPCAYRDKTHLCANPVEVANSRYFHWGPYTEGSKIPVDSASLTVDIYENGINILLLTLTFTLIEDTQDTLTYTVQASLHSNDDFVYLYNPAGAGGGMIRKSNDDLPATLATWSVDLTHDGIDETIDVVEDYNGEIFYVNIYSNSGQQLWSGHATTSHAGQNGIYLYEEQGKHYLMEYCNYGSSGFYSIHYRVFSLSETGETKLITERLENFEGPDFMAIDTDALRSAEEESRYLLSHSIVLASTNGDTPEGQYCSTPDNPISPIIGQSMWGSPPTADYIESLQARAKGTYTFRGEVLDVYADTGCVLVEDRSLWVDTMEYHFFKVPVDDTSRFPVGTQVEVTANGPLYRWNLPDEGTTVEITPVN